MILPSVDEMKYFYKEKRLKDLCRWLPHLRDVDDPFIKFLISSNLLKIQNHINDSTLTLGADPEFILCEKDDEDKIVLFSSLYVTDYFGLSEAEMGADYGLLEFRPSPVEEPRRLMTAIRNLHETFEKQYKDFRILEKEAVEFNHKRARVLESLRKDEEINYGMNRGKPVDVWAPSNANIIMGMETGTSLSAYAKPLFSQFNDKLFTAGGHIHIGGSYIMMLSFEQLKSFVKKLDEEILPLCKKAETKAGQLRQTVYGSPGEFRIKDYGIEYRSPSNAIFWKKNMDLLLQILLKVTDIAQNMALEKKA